jgi:hypothetical protein
MGCVSYVPASFEELAPGADVVLTLSRPAQLELERRTGITDWRMSGRLVALTEDSLIVSMPTVERHAQFASDINEPLHRRLDFARDDVLEVEAKHVEKVKTGGAVVLSVGFLTVITLGVWSAGGS